MTRYSHSTRRIACDKHTCKGDRNVPQAGVSLAALQGVSCQRLDANAHHADVLRVADAAIHNDAL